MGQEHIAVVRASFDAWNAGDMERVRDLHHPEAIVRAPPGWPEPGPEVGREAVMAQFAAAGDVRGGFAARIDRLRVCG